MHYVLCLCCLWTEEIKNKGRSGVDAQFVEVLFLPSARHTGAFSYLFVSAYRPARVIVLDQSNYLGQCSLLGEIRNRLAQAPT
jgi:hypothetical protein